MCSNYVTENAHTESPHNHDNESIFIGVNTCEKGFHFALHIDKSCLKQRLHRSH